MPIAAFVVGRYCAIALFIDDNDCIAFRPPFGAYKTVVSIDTEFSPRLYDMPFVILPIG